MTLSISDLKSSQIAFFQLSVSYQIKRLPRQWW